MFPFEIVDISFYRSNIDTLTNRRIIVFFIALVILALVSATGAELYNVSDLCAKCFNYWILAHVFGKCVLFSKSRLEQFRLQCFDFFHFVQQFGKHGGVFEFRIST